MTKYRNALSKANNKPAKLLQPSQPKQPIQVPLEKTSRSDSQQAKSNASPSGKPKPSLKKAALCFSRIHFKLNLRFETLFRALAIFKTYDQLPPQAKGDIPQEYLLAVCMFMAMKYEEIYPPELREVMRIIKSNTWLDMEQYRQHEKTVLMALDGDLDIPTPCTIIDQMMLYQEKSVYFYAYYLLEVSLTHESLAALDFKQLCLGVVYIMTTLGDFLKGRKSLGALEERIQEWAAMIIRARYMAIDHESVIYKKYTHEAYLGVAEKSIFIQKT